MGRAPLFSALPFSAQPSIASFASTQREILMREAIPREKEGESHRICSAFASLHRRVVARGLRRDALSLFPLCSAWLRF